MKRFASVLVRRRRIILALTLLCCCISLVLIPQVEINTDMTKYLPDDSSMQQGMDIMEVEFPDTELAKTIRVMFQGLEEEQIPEILATLESIEYVDSVAYEADSTDYNREDYTLFVVSTEYDYGSPQERAIEAALEEDFSAFDMVYKNDSTNTMDLPAWVIGLALTVLMIILFFMCSSWAEPFLFMLNIGIAIAINMGTNLILGSISTVTFSIAAILQLVLSMDYSVILMNRYRQEREHTADRPAAMEIALRNAFSSVVSSGMTTVVGLLMLVFMRFRIGMDLGIVLAKGVLITMICTFTSLPGLILLFDGLIMRTAKKALHIPTGGLAAFSYRRRRVLAAVFVALFIGSYFLKNATDTVFTLEANDPIVDIFPTENSLVLVYENQDEDQVAALAETLEDDPYVKSALSYSTTLARARTSRELADAAEELGGQTIDSSLLNIVYYHRFMDGQLPSIAAGDFLRFLQKDVLSQDTFDEYISQDMRQQAEKLERFSDPQALTTPMDAAELADFLELEESDVRQLLVLYLAAASRLKPEPEPPREDPAFYLERRRPAPAREER